MLDSFIVALDVTYAVQEIVPVRKFREKEVISTEGVHKMNGAVAKVASAIKTRLGISVDTF